ncbi:MAG: 50S ribosomal protein L35 [Parcubacteria group bacterium GW2011_GWA2_47_8]|nr:MAG: 50S ribosomal protein L35 [Parcubacteria group bacterium GW2011_GWA2_47_8]OHB20297.1 MAG: 50S ribosomal protein L35 [Parcubacteria group bacterium RIFCSPHIGHO2_01_FULL_47_10b]
MLKTNKSVLKRFKFTKTGKVMFRKPGLDHFRAKKSGKFRRNAGKWFELKDAYAKKLKQMVPYN